MNKKQVRLFYWRYMVNDNENVAKNENRLQRYDKSSPRSRKGHKYPKY